MSKYLIKALIGFILFPIAVIYDICTLPSTAYYDTNIFQRTKGINYLITKNIKKLKYS